LESGAKIDTYFAYLSNPAYSEPESQAIQKFIKDKRKIPFLVVMDTHMTETAMLSDLVLPAATFLESWGVEVGISLDQKFLVNFIQPAISLLSDAEVLRSPVFDVGKLLEQQFTPRGESKEIGNVCIEMARRLGDNVSRNFPFLDTQDFVKRRIASFPKISEKGGIQFLKQQGFFEYPLGIGTGQTLHESSEQMLVGGKGNSFPEYKPIGFGQKTNSNGFILTAFKSNLYAYGTANSKWVREFFHDNRLWMNKYSARRLGLKNGQKVRVVSSAGSLIVRLLVTGRIHPDSVALAEGLGHSAVGHVARGMNFRSKDPDTSLIWWYEQGSGVNPNTVMERKAGADGFSSGLKDTVVRIEKV
jgi:anaerobic selenocysteine-containing dehydrogenase